MSVPQSGRSNLTDLNTYRTRKYWQYVSALRQARDDLADGPVVLTLLNELTLVCEALFDSGLDENGRMHSCSPEAETFLARLARECEQSRADNGAIPDSLLDLLDALPGLSARRAA